jgi:DNA-binding Lrp family transcriptional regulator
MNGVTHRRMDEVDLRLCQLLIANARCPQRELADELGISVAGVHRRIQSLVDEKVVKGFTANISSAYLHAVQAQVDGVCECQSVEEVLDRLRAIGSVSSVLTSAANLTAVTLILKRIEDLGPTVEQVRDILRMPKPKVTISTVIYVGANPLGKNLTSDRELSRIDYRIINSLHVNCRKPIIDVADEIGITPKTARNRLELMEKDGLIEYGLDWEPARTAGACFIIRIDLKPQADRNEFINQLNKRFGARFLMTLAHSNELDYVCGYCWAPTVAQHNDLVGSLKADDKVKDVRSGIVHSEWTFETWRDRLLKERASGK